MRASPHEPPEERFRTTMPSIPIQTPSFGIVGGAPTKPSLEATAISAPVAPNESRIRGLKMKILEKYTSSRVLAIAGWLTKMERYFRLMKYPVDIWVDVIATRITNSTQAWLDKELQDVQLGHYSSMEMCNCGLAEQIFGRRWSKHSHTHTRLKWSMQEGSLWKSRWVTTFLVTFRRFVC